MPKSSKLITVLLALSLRLAAQDTLRIKPYESVTPGAARFDQYVPHLKGKRVAVITNATGQVGGVSLVDTLLKLHVHVKKIFGPEHGFRGGADAGAPVSSGKDPATGIPVVSLYGSNRKPTRAQLRDIDVVIYDIQDVGVRFYTYISTMCYAMEACAEHGKEFIVLDRPNPNGFYVDGPVMRDAFKSFLGLHPVPLVYGMTCGEYAMMANGEGWLGARRKCRLKVVELVNYDRKCTYPLPERPSPNLPNYNAVLLYPGLGLMEGTIVSLARGTPYPFQAVGHPDYPDSSKFCFVPRASALNAEPKYCNQKCCGLDLRADSVITAHVGRINLYWMKIMYTALKRDDFFGPTFNQHAGNDELQDQIRNQVPEGAIRLSWRNELDLFRKVRGKYLLYPDFIQPATE